MVLGQMAGGKPILPEMAGAVRLPVDVYWRDGIGDAGEIYPPASRRLFGGVGDQASMAAVDPSTGQHHRPPRRRDRFAPGEVIAGLGVGGAEAGLCADDGCRQDACVTGRLNFFCCRQDVCVTGRAGRRLPG